PGRQSSSLLVDRRARRAKTEGIDAEMLVAPRWPRGAANRGFVRWFRSRTKPAKRLGGRLAKARI
ncbi:MAG: hypothetical protein WBD78_12375, partial [Methylocella sp.]